MATYRYLLCDLLTDQKLAEMPLTGVTFDRRISRTGSLQATLVCPNENLARMGKVAFAYAGRSALWVYRDRELWWGGIPWTVVPTQGDKDAVQVSITAATFDSYAHHRELYADKVYAQVDQGVIVPDLWRTIQAQAGGNINMLADDQPTGVLRDRTYKNSDLAKVGKLIEDLGDIIDGPEHTVDTYLDGLGNRIKRLRVGLHLGVTDPRIVFQRARRGAGGRLVEWSHVADATDGGTSFRTRGAPVVAETGVDADPQLSTRVTRDDLLALGWPLLDVSADHEDTILSETLDGHAQAMAAQQGGAMPTSGYTVQVGNTGWSPNRLGDAVRLKLQDLWHGSTDVTVRPVGCKVTPPEKGKDERVELLLADEE